MKKFAAVLLASLIALTACGSSSDDKGSETAKYEIGTGVVTTEKVTNPTAEKDGSYQIDTYYATIVVKDGKIVSTNIDTAQNKQAIKADGSLGDFAGKGTKKEQGDDYGMAKYSNPKAVAEWYLQIAEVEKWTIDRTVAEVLAMKTTKKDDAHPAVPAESDLTSKVTITVDKYLEAIEVASKNLVEVKDLAKVGTASISAADKESIEINTDIATVAVDKDGKVVYAFLDTMQSKATFEANEIKASGIVLTKGDRKDDYGMPWYKQRDEYVKWLAGKDQKAAEGQSDVPSSVSIYTGGFKAVVDKAFKAAVEVK